MKTILLRSPFLLAAALVCASSITVHSQQKPDKTDEYIETQMRRQKIPGLSLAIVKKGKIIKARGYGLANLETNTPATEKTVYKIASVSKQLFSSGIMLLVQEGKVGLDDKVNKYFADAPETWKDISVRQLLSHTSGLIREAPAFDPLKTIPDAEIIKSAYKTPLQFPPGTKWQYSNVGYYILAEMITRVSGKSWSEFINERIFTPVGMTHTRTTTITDIIAGRANGYSREAEGLENSEVWFALRPSGAFLSTVTDLAKWDAALYTDSILNPSSKEQMWTPVKLNDGSETKYGFGWNVNMVNGHKRISHDGGLPGFRSHLARYPNDKLTLIFLSNLDSAELPKMAQVIAGIYLPEVAPVPEKAVADTDPEITAKVKVLIEGFIKGTFDMSLLAPDIAGKINEKMKKTIAEELTSSGKINAITLVEKNVKDDKRIYRYRLDYKNDSFFFTCTFDKDGKVVGFGTRD